MPLLLVLVLIGLPVLEIYVIVQVSHQIGALPTIALLLATSFAGAWLLRHEGARAWRAFNDAVAERRAPHREVADGMLVMLGGALMFAPGFVTDVVGLLCVFPPTRILARRIILSTAARRTMAGGVIRVRSRRGPVHPQERPGHGQVIEGEVQARDERDEDDPPGPTADREER